MLLLFETYEAIFFDFLGQNGFLSNTIFDQISIRIKGLCENIVIPS